MVIIAINGGKVAWKHLVVKPKKQKQDNLVSWLLAENEIERW